MASEDVQFHRRDAIFPALQSAGIVGGAGLFFASVRATLTKRNIGALGTFTQYGSQVAVFTAMGGAYEFFRIASANLREKDDLLNEAIGGFTSGAVIGIQRRTMPAFLGYGAGAAILVSAFDYTGGSLFGYQKDSTVDEYERKESLRKNKRRPIQQTLSDIGEGRGIYGPGYQERRRERIQQRYGIDVGAASS